MNTFNIVSGVHKHNEVIICERERIQFMKKNKVYCDICETEIRRTNDIFKFKVKSPSFVTWSNQEDFNADVRKFDVCRDCLTEIGRRIRENAKGDNHNENH